MAKVKNKNYQRIDNLIVSAFKELIKVKNIDKISVTELCEKAGVNRTTFYKHYSDTSEISDKLEEEIILRLFKILNDVTIHEFLENSLFYLKKYNEYLMSDIELCKQIFRPSRVRFIVDKANEFVYKAIQLKTPEIFKNYPKPCALKVDIGFFIGAITNLYLQYFRGFIECPLDNVATMVSRNITYIYKGMKLDHQNKIKK